MQLCMDCNREYCEHPWKFHTCHWCKSFCFGSFSITCRTSGLPLAYDIIHSNQSEETVCLPSDRLSRLCVAPYGLFMHRFLFSVEISYWQISMQHQRSSGLHQGCVQRYLLCYLYKFDLIYIYIYTLFMSNFFKHPSMVHRPRAGFLLALAVKLQGYFSLQSMNINFQRFRI